MTSRHRQLKEAQQRVNDAVAQLAARRLEINVAGIATDYTINCGEVLDVVRAFDQFDQLRRDLDGDAPHAHRDTSANAAKTAPKHGSMRRRILDAVVAHDEMYRDGMTCHELEARLRGTHQNVSPQVNYLESAGFIENSGRVRKTPSGREAIVWQPTAAGRAAVTESNLGAAS